MRKNAFKSEEHIEALNNAKIALQMSERPFIKETLLKSFKGAGIPSNSNFWQVFRKSGLIQETSKGKFMFTSKDPIHVMKLHNIYKEYQKYIRRTKTEVPKVETSEVVAVESASDIEQAISLLKEKGFQIFAPVGIVYRKL